MCGRGPVRATDVSSSETAWILAGTLAAKNMCNADCSSVAAIDSIVSFFLAKDTGCAPVTFGHKNETTGMTMVATVCGRYKLLGCERGF